MTVVAGEDVGRLFLALSEELRLRGAGTFELCVIGGTALGMLGLVERPTKDVDVVALGESASGTIRLSDADPLPPVLAAAVAEVAAQFGLQRTWLNNGPARLIDAGLPDGFEARLLSTEYGSTLRVHVASRLDQVCLKTYAAADVAGRHLTDLIALAPTREEMSDAFAWVSRQDPSEGFRSQLEGLADYLEVRDVLDAVSR